MNKITKYRFFFLFALAGHLSILGLFALNYNSDEKPIVKVKQETPEIIRASLLDETRVTQKAKELKQAQETKKRLQRRQKDKITQQIKKEQKLLQATKDRRKKAEAKAKKEQQAEQKRLDSIKKTVALEKKKQAVIKQKSITADKKRKADAKKLKDEQKKVATLKKKAEKKRKVEAKRIKEQQEKAAAIKKEAEKKKQIAADKKRKADAEKLRLQKIADENKRIADAKAAKERAVLQAENAKIAKQAVANASVAIYRKVTKVWNKPSNVADKLSCLVNVDLLPSGDVMSVRIKKSSGNAIFDASAERAVYKASPLPIPKDSTIFERNFRNFTFNFSPK
ncbi:MAG: cell envelope integrity protein TolA [Methyloprofundus sp.]|nr:cell envelope integrity protein TolA [Methyloprofundus sp.]